jgi:uncharacterized protein YdeI (BOF family)
MKYNLAILTVFGLGIAVAQNPPDKKMESKVTVTGCLSQGSGTDEYTIKDQSGKTYGLMGSKVNLKPHVGHEVSISGTAAKAPATGATSAGENVEVTDLKMVSTTCK